MRPRGIEVVVGAFLIAGFGSWTGEAAVLRKLFGSMLAAVARRAAKEIPRELNYLTSLFRIRIEEELFSYQQIT